MPRLASQKQRDELKRLSKNAKSKERRLQEKIDEISMEDFGFDSSLKTAYKDKTLTYKEANESIKQLKKFSNRLYGVVGIGSKDEVTGKNDIYVQKDKLKEAQVMLTETNEFYSRLNIALSKSQYVPVNIYKGEYKPQKGQDFSDPRIFREMLLRSESAKPYLLRTPQGKIIGGGEYLSKNLLNTLIDIGSYKVIKSNKELTDLTKQLSTRRDEMRAIKMASAKENYLRGLEKNFGNVIASKVFSKVRNLSNNEFLYLFYTTEAFTFSFLYSENELTARLDAITSQLEAFKKGKKTDEGYKTFIKEMDDLLPSEE